MAVKDRARAYRAVGRAVQAGRLVRPATCSRCGQDPGCRSDGRSLIQGHHRDYAKPLDVVWECPTCHHNYEHPDQATGSRNGAYTRPDRVRRGVEHGRAKITEAQVREIRHLATQGYGSFQLGGRYGLSHKTVRHVIDRVTWKHVA